MDQRGSVDRRNNRNLAVKQDHQEMLGILIDVVPSVGRHLREVPAHVEFGAVDVAGAGDDDDLGFLVAANLAKGVAELLMCGHAPLEGTTFGMKDGLQDTVAPLHLNVLVPVFVIVEFWHRIPSRLFMNRSALRRHWPVEWPVSWRPPPS